MQPAVWIAIYMPIIIVLFIIIPSENRAKALVKKLRIRRGGFKMSNELIKNSIGRECDITGGSLGTNLSKAKIIEVVDNWVKVESKKKSYLINIDFIQSIRFLDCN